MAHQFIVTMRDLRRVHPPDKEVLRGINISMYPGAKIGVLGLNGSGKSTLLRILAGEDDGYSGEVRVTPGFSVGYLPQEPLLDESKNVLGNVTDGVAHTKGLLDRFEEVCNAMGEPDADFDKLLAEQAELQDHIDAVSGWDLDRQLEIAMDALRLPPSDAVVSKLSGGERRRVALCRLLLSKPDLLLLDEPTNHLDLPTMEWLEELLLGFAGALMFISHDRAFLKRLATRVLWLDRGRLHELDGGFDKFEDWSRELIEREEREAARLDKRIAAESYWYLRGVTARRSRNEGRRRRLQALRAERARRILRPGRANLASETAPSGGQLVIEARAIAKSFGERRLLRDFSTRIMRGDRIGIVGANGVGKTTLLKLLLGEIPPDQGQLRHGTNLIPAYFDQRRAALQEEATLWQTLAPDGGDSVMVRGTQKHVVAYLREFLFDERQALMAVSRLSGGERARLLLARLFARPSNLLILDEPTNDLDLDTLDLLEEVLAGYEGTVLLVSHDRDFLDRLVSSVIVMAGDGTAVEHAGGYSDLPRLAPQRPPSAKPLAAPTRPRKPASPRLSFNEQRALERLPTEIERLTAEIARLESELADPAAHRRERAAYADIARRLSESRGELTTAEERWLELEAKREAGERKEHRQ